MRFERGEGASHTDIWRESVPDRGRPRVEHEWHFENHQQACDFGVESVRGKGERWGYRGAGGHITGLMGVMIRTPQGEQCT